MLGSRSRSAVALAAVLGVLGIGLATPAAAEDPPPLDWTLLSTTTVDDATVTWEVAEAVISPFDSDVEMLDPMPVYRPDIVNGSGETRLFGFGTDFVAQGVVEETWTPEVWGAFGDEMVDGGILGNFLVELAPGESYSGIGGGWYSGMPAWSGHTITIFALEPTGVEGEDPVATPIASVMTPGRFVPADLTDGDIDNLSAVLGQRATVTSSGGAPELLAGLAGTVEASGLPAGETLELWIAKDLNYAYFQILGGGLPVDALRVGHGTVGSNGVLSTDFLLPVDLDSGNYQLVIGDRSERYWPAGSYDDFIVTDPPVGLVKQEATVEAVVGGGGESVGFQWDTSPIGELVVGVTYPEGSTAGTTTALYSPTGPLPVGFVLATDPPLYVHVNTTVLPSGPAFVCINYDPASVTGEPPRLFHFDTTLGLWTDITDDNEVGPGYACGYTSSFSPLALGYPDTFEFEGFLPPVSMDAENIAKAGQAIPVKFSLGGDQGLDVVTSARFVLEGMATNLVGETISVTSTGDAGLSYDPVADEYTYVWKTNRAWSLRSGYFELTLSDDSVHTFDVSFKK